MIGSLRKSFKKAEPEGNGSCSYQRLLYRSSSRATVAVVANGKGEPIDKVCETADASSEFGFGGILVSTCQEMRKEKRCWTEKRQYADAVGL